MTNHPNRSAAAAERRMIREWALAQGERYRIRETGEVDICGIMPNSIVVGWWFAGHKDELIADILGGYR